MPAKKPKGPSGPETVICLFRVRKEKERAFRTLLKKHWPTLRRLGLATGEPSKVYRGTDRAGGPLWIEIFTWKDGEAAGRAHEDPAVRAIWGPMDACVESRGGAPKWEFPHVKPVLLPRSRG